MLDKIRKIGNPFKFTQREYEASLNALNIFFGAVIGVSLGSIENLSMTDYSVILVITVAAVSAILLVSYSHRKIWNALMLLTLGAGGYYLIYIDQDFDLVVPEKLPPTLAIWGLMALATEFTPRTPEPEDEKA